jgi:hypothetical protein
MMRLARLSPAVWTGYRALSNSPTITANRNSTKQSPIVEFTYNCGPGVTPGALTVPVISETVESARTIRQSVQACSCVDEHTACSRTPAAQTFATGDDRERDPEPFKNASHVLPSLDDND